MDAEPRRRPAIRPGRVAGLSAGLAVLLAGGAALVAPGPELQAGLELTLRDDSGREWLRRPWPEASLEALVARIPRGASEAGPLTARLEGLWRVDAAASGELWLKADGEAAWSLDGREVLRRSAESGSRSARRRFDLEPGWHSLVLELRLPGGDSTFAKPQWAPQGGPPRDLDERDLFRSAPEAAALTRRSAAAWLGRAGLAVAAAGLLGLAVLAALDRRRAGRWPAWWLRAGVPAVLLAVAGGLRFEAVVGQYWHVDAPGWAREARDLVAAVRPDAPRWGPRADPYRGDPWGYLQAAREPRGLYDAHVREPVFVLATKALLPLVGGHDVAVNLASAGFSTLAVLATYALGLRAFSAGVGFWAALLLAVERRVVALAVQGWRDDAFTFFTVLTALALVGLLQRASVPRAVVAGFAGGLACLTRITSLSFVAPGLAWLARPPFERRRLRAAGAALAVTAGVLGPYLIACQLAFGDPLYAINYHTGFYRARQGAPAETSMSVDSWLTSGGAPFATLDTMVVGLTHYPFANKWQHFEWIAPGLGAFLAAAALVGLLLFARRPEGRLLLVVLASSLLPYAFTWRIPGGGEWRFTLHAYPFYLLAAALAVHTALSLRPAGVASFGRRVRAAPRKAVAVAAAALAAAALVWAGLAGLFYLKAAEATRLGRAWRLEAGLRDGFFFGSGWSRPTGVGSHWERRTRGDRSLLRVPLEPGRDYDLTLRLGRLDETAVSAPASLLLNGAPVGRLPLGFGAERLGSHHVRLPGHLVEPGANRLEIRAGREPATLWYVLVAPASPGAAPAGNDPESEDEDEDASAGAGP